MCSVEVDSEHSQPWDPGIGWSGYNVSTQCFMLEIGIANVQRVPFITYCLITITAALQYCLIVCMQHGALHAGNLYNMELTSSQGAVW